MGAWMGANGGLACILFGDGMLEGLWRAVDGRGRIVETLPTPTRRERSELDGEIARVEKPLAVPAG